LAVGQEKLGMGDESVVKAVGLFGGGIACSGHTCGALLGAVAALSCLYSRGTLDGQESPVMWEVGGRMVRKFEELTAPHGGISCQAIARVNWRDTSAVSEFITSPDSRLKICVQLVGDVAEALGELIDKETPAGR
jgi:C_GCAxxG_C_C family probable redox protein